MSDFQQVHNRILDLQKTAESVYIQSVSHLPQTAVDLEKLRQDLSSIARLVGNIAKNQNAILNFLQYQLHCKL